MADLFKNILCGNVEDYWNAVMLMCELFRETAEFVGEKLGYAYNMEEGENCRAFLEHVRALPKDAVAVYDT